MESAAFGAEVGEAPGLKVDGPLAALVAGGGKASRDPLPQKCKGWSQQKGTDIHHESFVGHCAPPGPEAEQDARGEATENEHEGQQYVKARGKGRE